MTIIYLYLLFLLQLLIINMSLSLVDSKNEDNQLPYIILFTIYTGEIKYRHLPLLFESMKWNPKIKFCLINIYDDIQQLSVISKISKEFDLTNFQFVPQSYEQWMSRIHTNSRHFKSGEDILVYHSRSADQLIELPSNISSGYFEDMIKYGYLLPHWIPLTSRLMSLNSATRSTRHIKSAKSFMLSYRPYHNITRKYCIENVECTVNEENEQII